MQRGKALQEAGCSRVFVSEQSKHKYGKDCKGGEKEGKGGMVDSGA